MKSYLVDVPVMLFVFIRPDNLEKVFSVVRKARPSTLFLVSDGPREFVDTDKEKIMASRKIVENVDWQCKVYRLYSNVNQGMYATGINACEFIFKKVDRCILLEDDVVPSINFFQFCAELLEKYKDDLRINRICGMNHLGNYKEPNSDYFFSKEGSIWGFAIWKRTYENFDYDFKYGEDQYIMNRLKENATKGNKMWKKYKGYANGELVDGHIAGAEFFYSSAMDLYNQLNIVASRNMICNIGVGKGSTHSSDDINKLTKGIRQVFFMKTYEYDFPLKHPKYVIEDKNYQKKVYRIMGWCHPWIRLYRKCERMARKLIYSGMKNSIQEFNRNNKKL